MQGDHAKFQEYLERAVTEALNDPTSEYMRAAGYVHLQCDYDPKGILLDAVIAAGVECRGFAFSAKGILPMKTDLQVFPDHLEPKEGYGNWTAHIPV